MPIVYYPFLTNIIRTENFPGQIEFVGNTLDNLLNKIRFRNYIVETSPSIDVKFYGIEIVTKEANISVLGSGLELVFFKDTFIGQNNPPLSILPIEIEWRWAIKKYISTFNQNQFSFTPEAFLEVLLDLANINDLKIFIIEISNLFVTNDITQINIFFEILESRIDKYKLDNPNLSTNFDLAKSELIIIKNEFVSIAGIWSIESIIEHFEENSVISVAIGNLKNIIYTINKTISKDLNILKDIAVAALNISSDIDFNHKQLINLFQKWIGNFTIADLEAFLVPQFGVKLTNINMALEFPRKWLVPINTTTNEPETDVSIKTQFTFNVGSIEYSTRSGFHFQGENAFDFSKSMIGKTGLTIEIINMKLDLSRNINIPEAIADGRPEDFIGVYTTEAIIGLPEKWFGTDDVTLGIIGRNLLIGTGGISGTIGLEAIDASGQPASPNAKMVFTLGRKPKAGSGTRKGFKIGFSHFHMVWQQNRLIESEVLGSITIEKFKQCQKSGNTWSVVPGDLHVNIQAYFEEDGDFKITAKPTNGLSFCLDNLFIVTIKSLSVGKTDDRVFIEVAGSLRFDNNQTLYNFIKEPLEIQKLRIYSDGSFEFEGGKIPLPESVAIKIGPTEISITAIHFGSHTQLKDGHEREYKYFGFDGGVNVNPGGVDASGKGIKYYFTIDDEEKNLSAHRYLKLESLQIDLRIPGDAKTDKETTLIASGFLSLKEAEYTGSIKFSLPKAKIAGGAGMRYNKNHPAFLIDAFVELATGIPLASTGLAIFGFRGLFGLRYLASKDATGSDTWTEYYQAEPEKGIHVAKFKTPDDTNGSTNPISIGAGISLATQADDGKAFSSQLFLLLSLRNLILLEGKANVMGERVGITEGDPPFFALLVLDLEESVRVAMGADYYLPAKGNDKGKILRLYAEVDSAFFFKNSKAWYVHLGTKDKPITARIFDLFDAYSYLMINPKELEAGAGLSFGFDKKYAGGVVKASVNVYFDIWGRISFTNVQIGGGLGVGGGVSVSLFGIGFSLSINTLLTVEVPKPFKIHGEVELCVGVKLVVKKIEKCFKVQFTWEKKPAPIPEPIYVLPDIQPGFQNPAQGLHMISGKTYELNYFERNAPSATQIKAIIPLDAWIEIQFERPVKPNKVSDKIGGVSNAPSGYIELIPPTKGDRQELHEYSIESIDLDYYDPISNVWKEYNPYAALGINNHSNYKIGYWQKTGKEYNKIRLLAQDPFSYTEAGNPNWYVPEQMGLSPTTLFCPGERKNKKCINWRNSTKRNFKKNTLHQIDGIAFKINGKDGAIDTRPLPIVNPIDPTSKQKTNSSIKSRKGKNSNRQPAVCFENGGNFEIYFPNPVSEVELRVGTTNKQGVKINYYKEEWEWEIPKDPADPTSTPTGRSYKAYKLIKTEQLPQSAWKDTITRSFGDPNSTTIDLLNNAISKIVIESYDCDEAKIRQYQLDLQEAQQQYYEETDKRKKWEIKKVVDNIKSKIKELKAICCIPTEVPPNIKEQITLYEEQLVRLVQQKNELEAFINRNCMAQPVGPIKSTGSVILTGTIRPSDTTKPGSPIQPTKPITPSTGKNKGKGTPTTVVSGTTSLNIIKQCEGKQKELKKVLQQIIEIQTHLGNLYTYLENSQEDCRTCIFQVCWTTTEDYIYNINIPSSAAIEEDYQFMKEAIEKTIVPIWRPDTTYRVKIKLKDSYRGYDGSTGSGTEEFYLGFKTLGSLGHFPVTNIQVEQGIDPNPTDPHYQQLPKVSEIQGLESGQIEAPENMLKYYIDYDKSYPNADGDLLYAKPLYYGDPDPSIVGQVDKSRILLFFQKNYVHYFFDNWNTSYQDNQLVIDVIDPLETSQSSTTSTEVEVIRKSVKDYFNIEEVPSTIRTINAMLTDSICMGGQDEIDPEIQFLDIKISNLKPLKLYGAVIRNKFKGKEETVHNFNFQTSRYRDFKEHIQSYILKNKEDIPARRAVFTETWNLTNSQISDALSIMDSQPDSKAMEMVYTDDFDRLLIGNFGITTFDAPVSTEFNIIRRVDSNKNNPVIGIWIRSPEPFNNPKIPKTDLEESIRVLTGNSTTHNKNFKVLFSKDVSQVFIMKKDGTSIKNQKLCIEFGYYVWNGNTYEELETSTCTSHEMSFAGNEPNLGEII